MQSCICKFGVVVQKLNFYPIFPIKKKHIKTEEIPSLSNPRIGRFNIFIKGKKNFRIKIINEKNHLSTFKSTRRVDQIGTIPEVFT